MENQVDEITKKERVKELLKLSKQLEIGYMEKFVGQEIEFIPEIEKNGYVIGHTGNYLLIKLKNDNYDLHKSMRVRICQVDYPYVIGQSVDITAWF